MLNPRPRTRTRLRPNSVEAAVQTWADFARGPLPPPEHLGVAGRDLPYWHAIISARTRSDWEAEPWLLPLVAQLAWVMADLQTSREALAREGMSIPALGGRTKPNPRARDVQRLHSQQMALHRALNPRRQAPTSKPRPGPQPSDFDVLMGLGD